jgi:hypothetical protein
MLYLVSEICFKMKGDVLIKMLPQYTLQPKISAHLISQGVKLLNLIIVLLFMMYNKYHLIEYVSVYICEWPIWPCTAHRGPCIANSINPPFLGLEEYTGD